MRRKLTVFFILLSTALSLATGIGDLVGKSDILCSTSACMKVHSSSFGAAFSIPVGFYAAAFLILALVLYLKGRTALSSTILCGLLGIEAYFTFLQVFFINSICTICMIFFGFLIASAILARVNRNKNAILTGFMMFFIAHFAFFYPSVTLKPTLTLDEAQKNAVEIFASPSCSHCEDAIEDLRKVCSTTGTPLIVRPVSISRKDKEKSVKWVSGKLFQCASPTSYRLAEKIVWENESEARKLNKGKLAVPLILVRVNGSEETFRGWSIEVKDAINTILGTTKDLGIGTAQASLGGYDTRPPRLAASHGGQVRSPDVLHQGKSTDQQAMCNEASKCDD